MLQHFSISQLNAWGRCPEQYRRIYIEGDRMPPGIAGLIGSAVHKAAEENYLSKILTGEDQPLDVLQDAAADHYTKRTQAGVFIPREEVSGAKKAIGEGKDSAVALTSLFLEEVAPNVQPAFVERRIYLETPDLPLPWLGIVDCFTTDGALSDLKTSGVSWSQSKIAGELQPTLYRKLIQAETGEEPKEMAFEVLVKNKTPKAQRLTVTRNDEDFRTLNVRANSVIDSMLKGMFPPSSPGSWCCSAKWCGYWWTCPYISKHLKGGTQT